MDKGMIKIVNTWAQDIGKGALGLLAAVCLGLALAGAPAMAQGIDLGGGDGEAPVEIDAQGGIEWRQNEKVFIAAGPARATRAALTIDADEMRAYYRDGPGGKSEVYRLDALGNVTITSPGRVATGGHAVYDVDKAVIVLKDGRPVTLTSGPDVITTNGQLEFWELRDLAVARGTGVGGAEAVQGDKRIRAEVLTAHFVSGTDGQTMLQRVEAFDNVRIDTDREQAFSDRAAYNVPTGLARLTGSVKIKRGVNEINGCSADIDLNTGVSRMNSCADGSVTGQGGNAGSSGGSVPAAAPQNGPKRPRVHGVLAPRTPN